MGFFLLTTKTQRETHNHATSSDDKVRGRCFLTDDRCFLTDVNEERAGGGGTLLFSCLHWRFIPVNYTHTHTWQEATSRWVGWLTRACPAGECAPIMLRLPQPLVNPHCMKQPSGSPSSTLTSLLFPNLSHCQQLYWCVCAHVCRCVCECVCRSLPSH